MKLMVPFEENVIWIHERMLEKYEDLQGQCRQNGWTSYIFPIDVECRSFIADSTFPYLT